MSSCLVTLLGSITIGAINLDGSKVNFIGNVSLEGNHANASGGKGKFKDTQQYEEREHFTRFSFMSPIDLIEPDIYIYI